MSLDRLQQFIDETPDWDFHKWYCRQDIVASICRARMRRLVGRTFNLFDDNEEVIDLTILRILARQENYIDDGHELLDEFFEKCLFKTVSSLWNKQKVRNRREVSLAPKHYEVEDEVDAPIEEHLEHRHSRLAEILRAKTRMRGKILEYAENLPRYAEQGYTAKQIAKELNIKPSSLGPYRARIRRILAQTEKKKVLK